MEINCIGSGSHCSERADFVLSFLTNGDFNNIIVSGLLSAYFGFAASGSPPEPMSSLLLAKTTAKKNTTDGSQIGNGRTPFVNLPGKYALLCVSNIKLIV